MTDEQIRRYARHVLLPDVGGIGQRKLLGGAVVIGTLDGTAEAAVTYLAAAGVGTLVVLDRGRVQAPGFLFEAADVGRARLAAARERALALNPDVQVVAEGSGVVLGPCADLAGAAQAALAALRLIACG